MRRARNAARTTGHDPGVNRSLPSLEPRAVRTAVVLARGAVGAAGLAVAARRLQQGRASGWYFVALGGRQVVQAVLDARPGRDGEHPGLPPWVDEVVDVAHVATMLGAFPVARGHRAFALRGAASAAAWVLLDRWSDRR